MLKSKTLMFAALLAAFGAAQSTLPAVRDFVSPDLYGYITLAVAVLVAVLRVVTTKPLSEK
jgi:hypothetical protein